MNALNFTTQCLQNWRENPKVAGSPVIGKIIERLVPEMLKAPKFILPEGGRPIADESSVSRMFEHMKIPFPCVVLEYESGGVAPGDMTPSSKRIAVVWDISKHVPTQLQNLWDGPEQISKIAPSHSLLVQSICYYDDVKMWLPILGMVEIELDCPIETQKPINNPDQDYVENLNVSRMDPDFMNTKTTAYPTQIYLHTDDIVCKMGLQKALSLTLADSSDEVNCALNFAALTACGNVSSDVISAPAALNKKRLKSGKVEFFDARVLVVGDGGYKASGGLNRSHGTGHASPRAHLRRGHIRVLPTGNIWVNAAMVNAGQSAAIPQYQVKRAKA